MARGRFLSATIRDDKRLNSVSLEAEYLFLKTIPHLDRDGLISADTLWADVCPRRKELLSEVDGLIDELCAAGLVIAYDCEEGRVLWFPGFVKNQAITHYHRESPSRFGAPPGMIFTSVGLIPDELRTNSGESPLAGAEVKVEVEVKDQVEVEVKAAATAAQDPVFVMWTDNMPGTMTPHIAEQIQEFRTEYSDREIVHAIGIACERNNRSLGYVRGVLKKGAFNDSSNPQQRTGARSFAQQSMDNVNRVLGFSAGANNGQQGDSQDVIRGLLGAAGK